jgi:hypothetical protein
MAIAAGTREGAVRLASEGVETRPPTHVEQERARNEATRSCGARDHLGMTKPPTNESCRSCDWTEFTNDACSRCGRPLIEDHVYLDDIEALARDVVDAAHEEYGDLRGTADVGTDLQRSIVQLANRLRSYHYDGDGCLGH